jgi:hypothetical protein
MGDCSRCLKPCSTQHSCMELPDSTVRDIKALRRGDIGTSFLSQLQLSSCCDKKCCDTVTQAAPEVLVMSVPAEATLKSGGDNGIDLVPQSLVLPRCQNGAPGPAYELRGVILYYDCHFTAAVQHEVAAGGGRSWITADDTTVVEMGTWGAVVKKCLAGRNQPRVLLYQRVRGDR